MPSFSSSITLFCLSLLLFAASSKKFVYGAAVYQGRVSCGYGYPNCDEGYQCVRNSGYRRTCQKISVQATPTTRPGSFSWGDNPSSTSTSKLFSPAINNNFGLTSKSQHSLSSLSQSDHVRSQHSTGVATQPSEHAVSSSTFAFLATASAPPFRKSDQRSPTGFSGGLSRQSGKSTHPPRATGPLSNAADLTANFTAVVGVTGNVVPRRPIDVLQRDFPDVFNLLLLAFESIQKRNESGDLSYYQLCGIHGYPFISWQYPPKDPAPQLGYCTHASAIFTTWHRPYVVLLEQILYGEAVAIAKLFTGADASKYQAAAKEVRLPYWDWASDDTDSHLPNAVVDATASVVRPGSTGPTTIPNPLYNYNRRDGEGATVRGVTAEADLESTFAERQSLTNALFTDSAYDDFSANVEDIHNLVHVLVGGDMVDIATAAFDPIFWLHHCNVDRLMAIYQASHPNLYLTPAPRSPTYALSGPGPDDLSTPLYPFRHPDAREWTSDDVKTAESIFAFGYAYPEVPLGRTGDDLQAFAIQQVNELYGPKTADPSFQGVASGAPDQSSARREWNANVVVDSAEIPGSQQIRLFVGDSANITSRSFSNKDLAGVAAIFSSKLTTDSSANRLLNITVPLTQILVDKKIGLRPEDVVPRLAKDLHWVVEQVDDTKTPIPIQDLKSLQISVSSQVTKYSDDKTKLPVKSESETYVAPTNDKIGGLQYGQAPPVGILASSLTTPISS